MNQIRSSYGASPESLSLSIAAYKALISDYLLRAKQAEDMVVLLTNEKIPKEVFLEEVVNKIQKHLDEKGVERSAQYLGLLQTSLLALNALQKEQPNDSLLEIIKAITLATGAV